ncbi:MAG: hypothetical protein ACI85O_000628 [Saprospiraceae bacterium]|jgi:hypothetical protein
MKKIIGFALLLIITLTYSCGEKTQDKSETVAKTIEVSPPNYLAEGKKIAGIAFAELSGRLQKAMKAGGVPKAVSYCNLNAMPIIDSLSSEYNVKIKRTSSKIRNPLDAPTEEEKDVLESYQKVQLAGQALQAKVLNNVNQQPVFYAPIMMNDLCLKCHGKIGDTLTESDYLHIKQQYPDDNAIGYIVGDLRGMWSITFKK